MQKKLISGEQKTISVYDERHLVPSYLLRSKDKQHTRYGKHDTVVLLSFSLRLLTLVVLLSPIIVVRKSRNAKQHFNGSLNYYRNDTVPIHMSDCLYFPIHDSTQTLHKMSSVLIGVCTHR